jgi:hypothetical protein
LTEAGATLKSLTLRVSASTFVCSEKSNLCQIKSYIFNVPITFAADGETKVAVMLPEN